MPHLRFALSAVVLLLATACGTAKAGDKCSATGFLCFDSSTALECKSAVWVSLPCRGAGGCKKASDTVTCDMSANVEGDNCASTAEGKGQCSADGTAILECRNGTMEKTSSTCRTCAVVGDSVVCNP